MLWEISLLVIAIAFLLLIVFAIPTIIQIRKTVKNAELTTKILNQNLPGILTNLDEITTNLNQTTQTIQEQVDSVKNAVDKFGYIADDVVDFERRLRVEIETPILETVNTVSAVLKAVRAFLEVLRLK
jgi:uncharacterized protein YoxC